MATLQELNENLQEIRRDLGSFEDQKRQIVEEFRTAKASVKDLNKNIREYTTQIDALNVAINMQTDDAMKANLESQRDALNKTLQEATAERDRLIALGASKSEAEDNIRTANAKMQSIIAEFASDPRINAHLQEAIEIKYDEEIEAKRKEKNSQEELNKKFSLDLKNDEVFGGLVQKLAESYKEVLKIPNIILDEETKKKAATTRGTFTKNLNALRKAISARPEYANIHLAEEDFEAMIAGPNAEGEYEIPTLKENVETIDKATANLEERKVKIISKIKDALVSERIDENEVARLDREIANKDQEISAETTKEQAADTEIARLQGEIDALKNTFTTVDVTAQEQALQDAKTKLSEIEAKINENTTKTAGLDTEISNLATQIAAIGFDQTRFDALNQEADIPAELTDKENTAKTEFEAAKQALKAKGYISEDLYPEIRNYTRQINIFRNADADVRKAFLECETNDSPESREALKNAMTIYKSASETLTTLPGMEGLTVENWHDWLVNDLRKKSREGTLEDYYYDETADMRLDGVNNEYKRLFKKSHTLDSAFTASKDELKKVKDMQEAFLKGENVEYANVEPVLNSYKDSITNLFNALKDKGAKGLAKVEDLWGKLQGKLAKIGIFQKLFGSKANTPQKIAGTKPKAERNELNELVSKFETKKSALKDAEKEIEDHAKTKLGEQKYNELKDLREKEAKAKSKTAEKTAKEAEKANLGTEYATLVNDKTAAEAEVQTKQQELANARANGTATPEQQAKLNQLETEKTAQETEKQNASQARAAAEQEKARLEQEKANLQPRRPDQVVKNSREIAHGKGKELEDATLDSFEKAVDEER